MIQLIQRLAGVDRQTKSERCKAVIERVQLWGLDEQQVRDMAKLPELAVQPEQEEQPKRGKTAK